MVTTAAPVGWGGAEMEFRREPWQSRRSVEASAFERRPMMSEGRVDVLLSFPRE